MKNHGISRIFFKIVGKKADEDEDLELEEMAGNKNAKNGKKSKAVANKKSKKSENQTNKNKSTPSKANNSANFQSQQNPQSSVNGHGYDNYQNQSFQNQAYPQYPENQFYPPYQQHAGGDPNHHQMSQQDPNQMMSQQQNQMMSQQYPQQQQQYPPYSQQYPAENMGGYGSQQNYAGYDNAGMMNHQMPNGSPMMQQPNQMMPDQLNGSGSQQNQMMGAAEQPNSQLRQQLMAGNLNHNNGQHSLNLLQQHVNNQVTMNGNHHQSPHHVNGGQVNEIPKILETVGPGFDPFPTRDPEKKDEISYEWVS